jgi:Tol biopolymer transport system component
MERHEDERTPTSAPEVRLESWKAIAAYLQRNAVTVRRWEKEEGLPVHRHTHKARASVYAYVSEIDAWRAARRVLPATDVPLSFWKSLRAWPRALAFALTLGLTLAVAGGTVPGNTGVDGPGQILRQVWAGDADEVDDSGSVSFDGRYLAFTDWSTGDIGVRDLLTKTNRRLTDTGGWEQSGDYGSSAVISPDSSRIAYTWKVSKQPGVQLRVMPLSGAHRAEPQAVAKTNGSDEGLWPVGWTPDRRRLLVLRLVQSEGPMQELGMMEVADGVYRALKRSRRFNRPRLSPDGRWVAYGEVPDAASQVFDVRVLSTDGTRETVAVQNPANDVPMGWSPDGTSLYFVSFRTGTPSLWSVGIADGKPTAEAVLVRPDIGAINHLGVTRDGTFYYSLRAGRRSNVYSAALAPDGRVAGAPVLLSERLTHSARAARLSPDGTLLAYYSTRPGPEHLVIVRTLATGQEQDFRPTGRLGDNAPPAPAWFPDGRSLLFTETIVQDPGTHFVRLDVTTGARELLLKALPAMEDFRLSADGRFLFTVDRTPVPGSQATRLVRYDLKTRGQTDLNVGQLIRTIAISPDGRRIAFLTEASGATPGPVSLSVIPADGGPPREILRGDLDPANSLEWSADQKFLLFTRLGESANAPTSLWRIPADGGQATAMGLARRRGIHGPQMSPDGKTLFFTGPEAAFNEIWAVEGLWTAKE